MVRFARNGEEEALKRLWRICFGDSETFISFFFERCFLPDRCLVFEHEGQIAGMLHLLPYLVRLGGKNQPASYLYAAGTAPAARGRGVMSALLGRAEEVCALEGDALMALVPAGEGLFGYYRRRGFRTAFYHDRYEMDADGCGYTEEEVSLERAERPDELYELYLSRIGGREGDLLRDERMFRLSAEAYAAGGGIALRASTASGGDGYCFCHLEGKALIVREMAADSSVAAVIARRAARMLGAKKAVVHARSGEAPPGCKARAVPYGMAKTPMPAAEPEGLFGHGAWELKDGAYMSMMFD